MQVGVKKFSLYIYSSKQEDRKCVSHRASKEPKNILLSVCIMWKIAMTFIVLFFFSYFTFKREKISLLYLSSARLWKLWCEDNSIYAMDYLNIRIYMLYSQYLREFILERILKTLLVNQ